MSPRSTSQQDIKLDPFTHSRIHQDELTKLRKALHLVLAAGQKKQYWANNVNSLYTLDVAKIVANELKLDISSVICALLYGLEEQIAPSALAKEFGKQVAQTINELIKLQAYTTQFQKERSPQINEALIGTLALNKDPKVLLIKIAVHLQRMRTLNTLSDEEKIQVVLQTKSVYVPMAHRLGLNAIKAELEDLHLRFTNPTVYHALTAQLKSIRSFKERFIQRFKKVLQKVLEQESIPFVIKTRIKAVSSIWRKMQRFGLSFDQVYDVFAVRVILDVPLVDEKRSCWHFYESLTNRYRPHPKKFRNWLSYPRESGYQALHATVMSDEGVWVEVQIRTQRMDEIAERGHAAHWKYKEDDVNVKQIPSLDLLFNQVRAALEQGVKSSGQQIDERSANPEVKEIEVHTRERTSIVLPLGATVLDIAFELGNNTGLQCIGARVNDRLVDAQHVLKPGDFVKVIRSKNKQVSEDWFNRVVTYKARAAIKAFLHQEQQRKVAKGRKILKQRMRQLSIKWNVDHIKKLLFVFGEASIADLYCKLGEGSISLKQLHKHAFLKLELVVSVQNQYVVGDIDQCDRHNFNNETVTFTNLRQVTAACNEKLMQEESTVT